MFDGLFDTLGETLKLIYSIVNIAGQTMNNLCNNLDAVQFTDNSIVSKVLGIIKYFIGTPLYIMLVTLIEISAGFLLWKLIKIIINAVTSVIPGVKVRVE